ncbi:MAG TPA: glycosyltransferase family A protein [Bacteroidota bacterium]
MMQIGAIIPTRNRPESLYRLLRSLELQSHPLAEVIIADASDDPLPQDRLISGFPHLNLRSLHMEPSLCAQRNAAIRSAVSPHILLCSDDLEVPADYVRSLAAFLGQHPDAGAVSGLWIELDLTGTFRTEFPVIRFRTLLWNFIFQLTVWADVQKISVPPGARPLFSFLTKFYRARGNTWTLGGWPLVTQINAPFFHTCFFSLDGMIVKKEWLLGSPYDERLGPHGIGENYGVALGFPGPLTVVTNVHVLHHKEQSNRLPVHESYFRRILALHYFMRTSPLFKPINRVFLLWSLLGNVLGQCLTLKFRHALTTLKAIGMIVLGRNPYLGGGELAESTPRKSSLQRHEYSGIS